MKYTILPFENIVIPIIYMNDTSKYYEEMSSDIKDNFYIIMNILMNLGIFDKTGLPPQGISKFMNVCGVKDDNGDLFLIIFPMSKNPAMDKTLIDIVTDVIIRNKNKMPWEEFELKKEYSKDEWIKRMKQTNNSLRNKIEEEEDEDYEDEFYIDEDESEEEVNEIEDEFIKEEIRSRITDNKNFFRFRVPSLGKLFDVKESFGGSLLESNGEYYILSKDYRWSEYFSPIQGKMQFKNTKTLYPDIKIMFEKMQNSI